VKGRLDKVAVLNPDMSGLAVRDLAGQALASGSHHGRRIILLVVLVVIVVIVAVVIAYVVRSRRNRTGTPTGGRGGGQ
jgi:heme/copper-type cytochrome/quinol oxidase subunit 2